MRLGPLNLTDRRTGWALIGIALVFLLVYPEFESSYHIYVMASLFLTAILVTSLNLSMGYAGLPNFVTTGLYAFAAYGSGILAVRFHWSVPLALVAGVVATTLFGALIAATSLRASYLYFGMATLAFDLIIVAVADQWTSMTGGDTGLSGVPRLIVGGYIFKSYGMYHLALAVLVAPITFAQTSMGVGWMLKGFIASLMGGLGSVRGALVGGLLLGVFGSVVANNLQPGWADAVIYALLALLLVFRPTGLFARPAAH